MFYVYRFLDENDEVIYVGRTNNMFRRMVAHFYGDGHLAEDCYKSTKRVEFQFFELKADMVLYEIYYISKYRPLYNTIHNDSYTSLILDDGGGTWETYEVPPNPKNLTVKQLIGSDVAEYSAKGDTVLVLNFGTLHSLSNFTDKDAVLRMADRHKKHCSGLLTKTERKIFDLIIQNSVRYYGVSWLPHKRIARELGCSTKTVQRGFNKLEELGIVQVFEAKNYWDKRNSSNIVRIINLDDENHTTGGGVDIVRFAEQKMSKIFKTV